MVTQNHWKNMFRLRSRINFGENRVPKPGRQNRWHLLHSGSFDPNSFHSYSYEARLSRICSQAVEFKEMTKIKAEIEENMLFELLLLLIFGFIYFNLVYGLFWQSNMLSTFKKWCCGMNWTLNWVPKCALASVFGL